MTKSSSLPSSWLSIKAILQHVLLFFDLINRLTSSWIVKKYLANFKHLKKKKQKYGTTLKRLSSSATQRQILLSRRQLHALAKEEEDKLHSFFKEGDHQGNEGGQRMKPHWIRKKGCGRMLMGNSLHFSKLMDIVHICFLLSIFVSWLLLGAILYGDYKLQCGFNILIL